MVMEESKVNQINMRVTVREVLTKLAHNLG
jgi:hypothetical protein